MYTWTAYWFDQKLSDLSTHPELEWGKVGPRICNLGSKWEISTCCSSLVHLSTPFHHIKLLIGQMNIIWKKGTPWWTNGYHMNKKHSMTLVVKGQSANTSNPNLECLPAYSLQMPTYIVIKKLTSNKKFYGDRFLISKNKQSEKIRLRSRYKLVSNF